MTFVKPEMTNVIFFYFLLMKASLKAEQPGPCHYHISLSRLSTLTETTLPPFSSCQLQLSLSRNDPWMKFNKQYFNDCQAPNLPTQYQSRYPNVHSKSIELNSKLQKLLCNWSLNLRMYGKQKLKDWMSLTLQ